MNEKTVQLRHLHNNEEDHITEDEIDVDTLTNTITSAITEKVPTKSIKQNSICLPIEIRELICQKRHQRRLWLRTRIPQYKTNVNRLQKRISKVLNQVSLEPKVGSI